MLIIFLIFFVTLSLIIYNYSDVFKSNKKDLSIRKVFKKLFIIWVVFQLVNSVISFFYTFVIVDIFDLIIYC